MGEAFIVRRGGSGCKDAYLTQFEVTTNNVNWEKTVTLPLDVKAFKVAAFSPGSTVATQVLWYLDCMTPLITEPCVHEVANIRKDNGNKTSTATITVEKTATAWQITAKVTGQSAQSNGFMFALCVE